MACNRYQIIIFLFLLALLGLSGSKGHLIADDHLTTKKARNMRPLIFIHGLKGSHLVDNDEHVKWINASTVLGLSRPNLSLPLSWSRSAQARDELSAKEPISQVRLFPSAPGITIYGKWLKAAKEFSQNHLLSFAYDWRRDNGETSIQFEKFIEKAVQKSDKQKCTVVAHSMGGLITLSVMNRRPELFDRVIFAGVPFRGSINFMQDMTHGKPVGLNRSVLSPTVLFTFPSVYSIFPGNMDFDIKNRMLDPSGTPLQVDLFSYKDWQAYQLGVFANQDNLPYSNSNAIYFLKNTLKAAKNFRSSLITKKIDYPPVLVISGNARPTIAKVQQRIHGNLISWDFNVPPSEPGDGRIPESATLPPEPIQLEIHHSTYEHTTLLNDPAVIERVFSFINK